MATGGVNLENASEYIKAGADALGIGSALMPKEESEFDRCAEVAQRLLEVARNARATR
jgi:2-dehydro-3-deoxyphosphogluconate aldolase/(4S)-4-hydroxy-2-oxoglutarate aldolase